MPFTGWWRRPASPTTRIRRHSPNYRDLVEPFGLEVDEALLRDEPHVSHCDLVDRLVEADGGRGSEPDLVIVAQALPDVTPFTAITPYLDKRLGGTVPGLRDTPAGSGRAVHRAGWNSTRST
ncbi:hypothetical protein [Streptomyces sp. NPDC057545]|uniref:hypothetical protein n=1 Tax=unclassified Streptomyces TaxID=2593676 RepID=UPI0036B87733